MSVQFNLLPDVKLEFDRAQHIKRAVYLLSFVAAAVAAGLFVISFLAVNVLQKQLLNKANNDITSYSNKLKNIPNLDKILTVQSQLKALPGLHQQKHYSSRLFTYLPEITPDKVNIGKLRLDTGSTTLELTGTANTVESVNKFVDTLKFTGFTASEGQKSQKAFSNVVLSKIDRDDKGASYTINCKYDPALFSGSNSVKLAVPTETTTRSVINAPSLSTQLFNGQTQTQTKALQPPAGTR